MGIFKDLGFKNRDGVISAPSAEKFAGYTLDEVKSMISPTFINIDNSVDIDGQILINGNNIPSNIVVTEPWIKYQAIAYGFKDSGGQSNINDIFADGSCIATYPLDGNTNTLLGTYNATPSSISYTQGIFNDCAVFNGTSSSIAIPNNTFCRNYADFSVSGWINTNKIKVQPFIQVGGYANGYAVGLTSGGNFNISAVLGGVKQANIVSSETIVLNTWYHFCSTFDSTTLEHKLYINNVLVGNATGSFGDGAVVDKIGGSTQNAISVLASDYYFSGKIDQFRIFNKVVSESEVFSLYNETEPIFRKLFINEIEQPILSETIINGVLETKFRIVENVSVDTFSIRNEGVVDSVELRGITWDFS